MTREEFDHENDVRTDGKIHMEAINIDALDNDSLVIAANHPALHKEVRAYASAMMTARRKRLDGEIGDALRIERQLDLRYNELIPSVCRW